MMFSERTVFAATADIHETHLQAWVDSLVDPGDVAKSPLQEGANEFYIRVSSFVNIIKFTVHLLP